MTARSMPCYGPSADQTMTPKAVEGPAIAAARDSCRAPTSALAGQSAKFGYHEAKWSSVSDGRSAVE